MKVLVFNCGSSSIKFQLFSMPEGDVIAKGMVQRIGEKGSDASMKRGNDEIKLVREIKDHTEGLSVIEHMLTDPAKGAVKSMDEIGACGHRVVHGGEGFTASMLIDERVEKVIEEYCDLAPLHNPPNLTGIREAKKFLPSVPQVACFDTAFHQTIPETAYLYALPYELYEKFKVRRYGFHGTSHRYVAERGAALLKKPFDQFDAITCHLGNGCSMAAVKNGKCVDTTMGLTPLEGLVMGTRTGDFDPAIIFYLERKGYSLDDVDTLCNKKSGLLGISGVSNDVRDLEEKAAKGEGRAALALEIFAYRIRKYIGAYLAVLNGANAIIVTGGIGENGPIMRKRIFSGMEKLGIILDASKNTASVKEGEIQASSSAIKLMVVPTNEEGAIARDTYAIATKK
ncbi:MAG: acetate kinase [Spirochaetota bacterium]|mgnify:CR=1 FL=1